MCVDGFLPPESYSTYFSKCAAQQHEVPGALQSRPGARARPELRGRRLVGRWVAPWDAAWSLGTGCRPASVPGGVDVPVAAAGSPELHGARFRVSLVGLCPPGVGGAPTPPGEQCTVQMSLGGAAQLSAAGLL